MTDFFAELTDPVARLERRSDAGISYDRSRARAPGHGKVDPARLPRTYTCGLDLGQLNDFTALSVVERVAPRVFLPEMVGDAEQLPPQDRTTGEDAVGPSPLDFLPSYHLVELSRAPLGTPYPQQVRTVQQVMDRPEVRGRCTLVVDASGLGQPVIDLMVAERMEPVEVVITGGGRGHVRGRRRITAPLAELVSNFVVLAQQGRFKIAADLDHAREMVEELGDFQMRVTASGRETFGNFRSGSHDDLLMSTAMALYYAERRYMRRGRPVIAMPDEYKE